MQPFERPISLAIACRGRQDNDPLPLVSTRPAGPMSAITRLVIGSLMIPAAMLLGGCYAAAPPPPPPQSPPAPAPVASKIDQEWNIFPDPTTGTVEIYHDGEYVGAITGDEPEDPPMPHHVEE